MTVIKFEPFKDLESLSSKMQKFFDDYPAAGTEYASTFHPKIDITESENSISIEAELPGVKKEDIKLQIEDNILTISGEKKNAPSGEKNYFRSERCFGNFSRRFTIPADVDIQSVAAEFTDGILNINIEKRIEKHAKERTIEIK
jgi:HSP20 family protein